ncbi:hypothetical protein N7582_001996 [Saccharomyces uvarum]|nr:hypothetical protein N7582_001996 [Saccharomyces uvarum]
MVSICRKKCFKCKTLYDLFNYFSRSANFASKTRLKRFKYHFSSTKKKSICDGFYEFALRHADTYRLQRDTLKETVSTGYYKNFQFMYHIRTVMPDKETSFIKPFKFTAFFLLAVLTLNLSYKLLLKRYLRSIIIWFLGIANTDHNDIMWWQASPLLERWIWRLVDSYESKYE